MFTEFVYARNEKQYYIQNLKLCTLILRFFSIILNSCMFWRNEHSGLPNLRLLFNCKGLYNVEGISKIMNGG
jgi:hypothetical protein